MADVGYDSLEAENESHPAARCDRSNIGVAVLDIQRFGRNLRDSRRKLRVSRREPSIGRSRAEGASCDTGHIDGQECRAAERMECDA